MGTYCLQSMKVYMYSNAHCPLTAHPFMSGWAYWRRTLPYKRRVGGRRQMDACHASRSDRSWPRMPTLTRLRHPWWWPEMNHSHGHLLN